MKKEKYIIGLFILALLITLGCEEKKSNEEIAIERKRIDSIKVADTLEVFPFVGYAMYRPGIYVYDFDKRKSKVLWQHSYERVIHLSHKSSEINSFFLTAWKYGKNMSLPYLDRVRLYTINSNDLSAKRLLKLGNGLQVATRWEDSTFKVIMNSVDTTYASYIDQKMYRFDYYGKQLKGLVQTYDITRDGYPQFPADTLKIISDSGNFALRKNEHEEGLFTYSLIERAKESETPVLTTSQSLRKVVWKEKDSLLFFSTFGSVKQRGKRQPEYHSHLIVFGLSNKNIISKWDGPGYKNYRIDKNILAFDNDFERNSFIILYDLRTFSTIDTIKTSRGCGIAKIPQFPE